MNSSVRLQISQGLLRPLKKTVIKKITPRIDQRLAVAALGKLLIALALGMKLGASFAQPLQANVPDAGAVRQQIERQRMPTLPRVTRPEPITPAPELKDTKGMSVTVRAFAFKGHELLSTEQLQVAVAHFMNRPLGFEGLQKAADAVAATYREAGWCGFICPNKISVPAK